MHRRKEKESQISHKRTNVKKAIEAERRRNQDTAFCGRDQA